MLADLNHRLDYELRILKDDRDKYARRLDRLGGLENTTLRRTKRKGGRCYYYAKHKNSDRYIYIGKKDARDVQRILEAHCAKETLRRIDNNIDLINSFIGGYLPYDQHSVNADLPEFYKHEVFPVSDAYRQAGEAWMADRLKFQKRFPENYPENKTERTSDGVMVKTLSEVLVYERFKDAGFYEIYELPLVLNDFGPALYPDLTVLSPVDLKTEIIVEYVGRLDLQQYREGFARRVGRYIENGYIPGVNLFFIFGDKNGHIDSAQISRVIAEIRGI